MDFSQMMLALLMLEMHKTNLENRITSGHKLTRVEQQELADIRYFFTQIINGLQTFLK